MGNEFCIMICKARNRVWNKIECDVAVKTNFFPLDVQFLTRYLLAEEVKVKSLLQPHLHTFPLTAHIQLGCVLACAQL